MFLTVIAWIIGILLAIFALLCLIAVIRKPTTVYRSKPELQNPMEGKTVRFVYDEKDCVNSDGVCGHLEVVGDRVIKGSRYERFFKRALDILISFFMLVVLSPVFLIITAAILMDDPGPILFTQRRVGQNKRYFQLHKFRSMKMSTPHDVPTHMLERPEQFITKVGWFLRAHSLDELPQIWDIFIGNMSLVGPRPALWNQDLLIAERERYCANDVRPGLTGLAQLNGRDELDIAEKARLDGEYVKNLGFSIDCRCFFSSLHVIRSDSSVVEGKNRE